MNLCLIELIEIELFLDTVKVGKQKTVLMFNWIVWNNCLYE